MGFTGLNKSVKKQHSKKCKNIGQIPSPEYSIVYISIHVYKYIYKYICIEKHRSSQEPQSHTMHQNKSNKYSQFETVARKFLLLFIS